MDKHSDFSCRLRIVMAEQKMSTKDTAAALGMSYSSLQAYHSGERVPKEEIIIRIAKKLGVPAPWLAGYGRTFGFDCSIADYVEVVNAGFEQMADEIATLSAEIDMLRTEIETPKGG